MKRGFTLIELLAVIVLLSVISLIATPIVLNIIHDTKISSYKRSLDSYIYAINNKIIQNSMTDNKISDGVYLVDTSCNLIYKDKKYQLDLNNCNLNGGFINIKNGKVINSNITKGRYLIENDDINKTTWDGSIKEVMPEDNIYHVSLPSELAWIAKQVNNGINNFSNTIIVLDNSLDLGNVEWTPIGNSANHFKGTFDGNNNTISNLKINKEIVLSDENKYKAFFGYVEGGELKNINIINSNIIAYNYVASLVSVLDNGKVSNVNVYSYKLEAAKIIGAIIGVELNNSEVNMVNAYNGTINGSIKTIGGIAGAVQGSSLSNSYTNGTVISTSTEKLSATGGVTGTCLSGCRLDGIISYANVRGYSDVGGITGHFQNECKITNSVSYANVEGTNYTGGITGCTSAYNSTLSVDNIKSYATVTGSGEYTGGVFASISQGINTFTNVYSEAIVKGNNKVGGISGGFPVNYATTLNYKNFISKATVTGNTNFKDIFGYIDPTTTITEIN